MILIMIIVIKLYIIKPHMYMGAQFPDTIVAGLNYH
jgi:hypothetical protein